MRHRTSFISITLFFVGLLLFTHCSDTVPPSGTYRQSILDWQESRNAEMRDTSDSWLSLVALHWLEQGETTFGSDSANALVFPKSAPGYAGTFVLQDTVLRLIPAADAGITQEGQAVGEMILRHDMQKPATILHMGSITFFAIQRPEGMAIRVKDSQNPDLLAFEDIPNFPVDPAWKVEARLDWFASPRTIQIPTVLGSERTQQWPAWLVFSIGGEEFQLAPYESYYGEPVWTIIFGDATNGESTYGGGRFLEIPAPAPGTESIVLDFNQAYNPPCAFSPFATCPLPPPENRLPIAIPAGEQMYGEMH